MFSLWDESRKIIKKCFKDKPSPAKSSETVLFSNISQIQNQIHFIPAKRIPRLTLWKRHLVKASMTVEACFLLPTFIFFVLHVFATVEMMRLGSNLMYALWRTGNVLTTYEALSQAEMEKTILSDAVMDVGSAIALQTATKHILGEDYLETSPLRYGVTGLNFLVSDLSNAEECVDIVVTYQVRPAITIFPFPYTRMANRYYGRAFTGYDVTGKKEMVYVAEHGTVWHKSAECSYIHIPFTAVKAEEIANLRTGDGGKYVLCKNCKRSPKGNEVYITYSGECYHYTNDCSSLRRHVIAIWKEEIGELSPCSKCSKEDGKCI